MRRCILQTFHAGVEEEAEFEEEAEKVVVYVVYVTPKKPRLRGFSYQLFR
jgi:hypothetical protein